MPGKGQQWNNWYFGRKAALSFNPKPGKTIPYALDSSIMFCNEACASISDLNGNLLFYTDGTTVYNRHHQIMINGDGLAGNISATQCAIVPMPGNDNIFYIFTTDAVENNFQAGYNYSMVDMSVGDGQVVSKNVSLWSSCTERMAIVRHQNGIDTWLITNDKSSNIFRSWLITCNGLQPNPVVSTAGIVLDQHIYTNSGVMKASPDGKYLCQTHFPYSDDSLHYTSFAQLFDFDNSTGVISNARKIDEPLATYSYCCFSPDSKLLYLTRGDQKKIDQFDITLPAIADILSSRFTIITPLPCYDIQLAPNEKIYISKHSPKLEGISYPNVKGAGCNYNENAADALPYSSYLGLPSIINDLGVFNNTYGFNYSIIDSCSGIVQFNGFSNLPAGSVNWSWDFGDSSTSSVQDPVHTFNPANKVYEIKLLITSPLLCSHIALTKFMQPLPDANIKADFSYLVKCDSGYVRFINNSIPQNNPGWQFTWDFGDGGTSNDLNPKHFYNTTGNYTVKLKLNSNVNCIADSITQTINITSISITASPDQTIQYGGPVQLFVNGPIGATYIWSPGTWLNNAQSATPTARPLRDIVYTVTGTDNIGCKAKDSVTLHVLAPVFNDIYMPSAFTPNNDGINDVMKPTLGERFTLKEFSIYDRWGQKVFTTSQKGEGWNGKINGVLENSGVYIWMIEAVDDAGIHYNKKGSFILIR